MATHASVYEIRQYRWKEGFPSPVPADVVGQRIEAIRARKRTDEVTPEDLVDDARPASSPLHPLFEWNDAVAAEAYRREQARHILRSLVVEIIQPSPKPPITLKPIVAGPDEASKNEFDVHLGESMNGKPVIVRAYHRIFTKDSNGYIPTLQVLSDEDKRKQLLEQARRELAAFRTKYQVLSELADVFAAIDRLLGDTEDEAEEEAA